MNSFKFTNLHSTNKYLLIRNDVLLSVSGAPNEDSAQGPGYRTSIVGTKVNGGEPLGVIKSISAGIMSS